MERIRWSTAGRHKRLIWTRRWWIPFVCGFMAIVWIRAAHQPAGQQTDAAVWSVETESAPVEPETSGKAGLADLAATRHNGRPAINKPAAEKLSDYDKLFVSVYLTKEKRIEKMPIELYVRGVVAGEMPIDFAIEALKAQAVAARTYIYRRLMENDRSGMPEGSGDAEVTDTIQNQVYIPLAELLNRWDGMDKKANLEKLNKAVEETKGQILTYNGEPIQAAFFSTSNGYTENASDYWNISLPYLRSVASPWDASLSPSYKTKTVMDIGAFSDKLGVKERDVRNMRVLETTEGKRIKTVAVGNKTFSGREMRERLGLSSSEFDWKIDGDRIEITSYGNGHGVGMSQWGADGMALEGKTAPQILAHYYTGTRLEQASKLPLPNPS